MNCFSIVKSHIDFYINESYITAYQQNEQTTNQKTEQSLRAELSDKPRWD